MSEKVFLILVDGMRIDAPDACGNDYVVQFKTKAKLLAERTVMPSVTLPCHMSLFHSVTPQRHGILTNTYVPQVHTVEGLVERLKAAGKTSAFYYSWQLLRDLCRPGNLSFGLFYEMYTYPHVDRLLTEEAIARTAIPQAPIKIRTFLLCICSSAHRAIGSVTTSTFLLFFTSSPAGSCGSAPENFVNTQISSQSPCSCSSRRPASPYPFCVKLMILSLIIFLFSYLLLTLFLTLLFTLSYT